MFSDPRKQSWSRSKKIYPGEIEEISAGVEGVLITPELVTNISYFVRSVQIVADALWIIAIIAINTVSLVIRKYCIH